MLTRWLVKLGLRTEQQRAWATYDWANSAFQCTIITAVFPVYFASVAADNLPPAVATERFATATTLALAIVAIIAPVLGAYADFAGAKKRLLAIFLGIGVISTAAMVQIGSGDWLLAAVLFVIANIGVSGSFVFYDSLLPHVAEDAEMDRVSSAGYALGYLGGGVLLAINLAWILKPGWFGLADAGVASRLSFLSVAIWWLVVCDSAVPQGAGARRAAQRRLPPASSPVHGVVPSARGDAARTAPVPAGVPDAGRVPDLQRRHRHDHPHGRALTARRSGCRRTR